MRAFIAIDVPYFKEIENLQKSISGRFKAVEPHNLHLTLKFLGDVEEREVESIVKAMESCRRESFSVRLKGIGFFPNENYVRVLWIGIEDPDPLVSLMKCLDTHLSRMGFEKEKKYIPHLTIARVKSRISIENRDRFTYMNFGIFQVTEIKLKKSTLTEKGPIYEDIAVVSLYP